MFTTVFRSGVFKLRNLLPVLVLLLSGCGLWQKVTDSTGTAVKSVFYKQIKTLHLDFTARTALNTDSREQQSASQPVMVRVYQLKDDKIFSQMVYEQLVSDGDNVLKADLLAERSMVVKPDSAVTLDMPLDEGAKFVAVVALFRQPDMAKGDWRQLLKREDLDPDKARKFTLDGHTLVLVTEEK